VRVHLVRRAVWGTAVWGAAEGTGSIGDCVGPRCGRTSKIVDALYAVAKGVAARASPEAVTDGLCGFSVS
jgi:hypothetical protein